MTSKRVRKRGLVLFALALFTFGCSEQDATPTTITPDDTTPVQPPSDDPADPPSEPPAEPPEDPPTDDPPTDDPDPARPEHLLDATHLTTDLFGWPERSFGRGNSATIEIFRRTGDAAVDFTLDDSAGTTHSLASLLAERPVLLVLGSFT